MQYLDGHFALSGKFYWQFTSSKPWDKEEGIRIAIHLYSSSKQHQRRPAIKLVEEAVKKSTIPWISPSNKKWTFDLDKLLTSELSQFENTSWLNGKVHVEPEFETSEKETFGRHSYEASVVFYITPEEISNMTDLLLQAPIEIHESLFRFNKEYPDPQKTAFMMRMIML